MPREKAARADCFCLLIIPYWKTLNGFREIFNCLIGVTVFDAIPDTVLDMPFQYNFSAAMERGFGGIDLRQYILAGDILVDHTVDSLYLSNDFFQTTMQIICIHALFHLFCLHTLYIIIICIRGFVNVIGPYVLSCIFFSK